MAKKQRFSARIEQAGGGGAFVTVPFDVENAFGKKRVPVQATIDGVPYRGSLVRMGGECHVLGILKSVRAQIGKEPGDVVEIELEEDLAPREVAVPSDLADALLGSPSAERAFEALSFSHKREYVTWIDDAKREETRRRRIAKTLDMLDEGLKRP